MISVRRFFSLSFTSLPSSHMDRLHIFTVFLLGVVSYMISGSLLEVTVRPGDNITLYCDCKLSSGVFIVWYRNCSHENQPSLVLKIKFESRQTSDATGYLNLPPPFHYVRNKSSESYDLLIMNITDVDEGLYYCGTEQAKVEDKEYITQRNVYSFGNVTTKIIFNSSNPDHHETTGPDCGVCWSLLFSLCPALAVLSSLLSSLVVYHICKKKAKEPQVDQQRPDTRDQTRLDQDEDVCYAALEILQASQRPKKKKTQSADFSTYSGIRTSRL
ncbi:uncharacterized protein LOC119899115 [Micropterus salmoides]|uniref:uncharacterized protein LOC119899115 n=1 Tax=Micropterus salmoides TaxID=27706 RepID=UPI0018EAB9CB|nr:uncharacterized protein LOC119899115 [Micropterus salmoides]